MTSELVEAVKASDATGAKALAAAHPDLIRARDEEGLLPAVHALYRGQADLARDLLPSDAELSIFEAATFGRAERVTELLEEDPGLAREWSPDGFTVLHLALFSGSEPTVRAVLDRDPDLEAASRSSVAKMVRPIHTAVFVRNVGLAQLLLDAGVDVNGPESGGATPLHAAAQNGDLEMARLLLARGADPGVRDDQGRTPGDLARESEVPDLLVLFGDPGPKTPRSSA
jgi:ankyrin repeat protein